MHTRDLIFEHLMREFVGDAIVLMLVVIILYLLISLFILQPLIEKSDYESRRK